MTLIMTRFGHLLKGTRGFETRQRLLLSPNLQKIQPKLMKIGMALSGSATSGLLSVRSAKSLTAKYPKTRLVLLGFVRIPGISQ